MIDAFYPALRALFREKISFPGKKWGGRKERGEEDEGKGGGGWDLNDTVSSRHPCFLVFRVDETDDN